MNDLGWEYVIDLNDSAASPASETLDLTATISQSELDKSALTVRNCARKTTGLGGASTPQSRRCPMTTVFF